MRKLLYISAVIFGLYSIVSFVLAGVSLYNGNKGDAALYIIFTFSGVMASVFMLELARE